MTVFVDGSTEINADNLNKFMASGDGSIGGLAIYSMHLIIKNNGGTFQYKLFTNNNVVGGNTFLGDLGATHEESYTNVGDGIVDHPSAGTFEIILSGISRISVVSGGLSIDDSNISQARSSSDASADKITATCANSSGVLTDPAAGKIWNLRLMGFYK